MIRGKMTQEAVRDLLRADRIALEQGSRRVCPEHLLQAYSDREVVQRTPLLQLPERRTEPRRPPAPRPLSPRLERIVNRAETEGRITSEALRRTVLEEGRRGRRFAGRGRVLPDSAPGKPDSASSAPCNSAGKVVY